VAREEGNDGDAGPIDIERDTQTHLTYLQRAKNRQLDEKKTTKKRDEANGRSGRASEEPMPKWMSVGAWHTREASSRLS